MSVQASAEAQRMSSTASPIFLDLENLKCFEVVDRQFESQGVIFTNAIAIQPSNPAFPPRSGTTLLMAAPKSGWIEASFVRPICFVSGFVTSSRRIVLSAYNKHNQLLAQVEIPGANLADSGSTIPPNAELSIRARNIHRVTFYSYDGQLTLDDFNFSFK